MYFDIRWEIGMQAGLIGGIKSQYEVAFEIAGIVEMRSGCHNEVELKSNHMHQIGFIHD
jgi:hypothetical protein